MAAKKKVAQPELIGIEGLEPGEENLPQAQENRAAAALVPVAAAGFPAERKAALERLIAFQKALDEYLNSIVPSDELIWVQAKDGTKKPVLTRTQYAKIFRSLGLTEPDPPQFTVHEIKGEVVFECTTRVVWPLMGVQAYGVGCASTDEIDPRAPFGRRFHDAKAKAHTRAWERAIANLIGLGALGDVEVENHPELEPVSDAARFVLKMAAERGILEEEIQEYVQKRFGVRLSQLNNAQIVTLKRTIEQIKDRADFEREMARWKGGAQ